MSKFSRSQCYRVFKRITWCIDRGVEIDVNREGRELKQVNVIDLDSVDAQLIADHLEKGASYEMAANIINTEKSMKNEPPLTLSAVYGCARRLKPLVTAVKKRKQGSIDPQDPWSIARKNWCKQLLVRLRILQ